MDKEPTRGAEQLLRLGIDEPRGARITRGGVVVKKAVACCPCCDRQDAVDAQGLERHSCCKFCKEKQLSRLAEPRPGIGVVSRSMAGQC